VSGKVPDHNAEQAAAALADAFREYAEPLYRYVQSKVTNASVAEDLTSQVFLKALRWLQHERGANSIRGWLYATARTTIADYWSAEGPVEMLSLDVLDDLPDGACYARDETRHTRARALRLLSRLPQRERDVLTLRYLRGYDAAEIGRVLGMSPGHVRVLQLRALRHAAHLPERERDRVMEPQFDALTERTHQALANARGEAQALNHNFIGTEHVLLGLLHQEGSTPARVLAHLGVTAKQVRGGLQFVMEQWTPVSPAGEIDLTPRSKKALALAVEEAQRLGNGASVEPEHVLIGLVREGDGIAAGILESLGMTLDKVRTATADVLSE